GMSGIWIQLLWLFVTPFYWIIGPWYRRLRVLTGGDYFQERFHSRVLVNLYVFFGLLWFMFYIAIGLTAIGKTVEIITVKPETAYTESERQVKQVYDEFKLLSEKRDRAGSKSLTPGEKDRLETLSQLSETGRIKPFYSYIKASYSIPVIALMIIIYGTLGGLFAAAWTDTLQGMLIIVLSLLLLPAGLHQIGWFSGLHAATPDYMFNIIGSAETSEYTWYYIVALILMNLVGVAAQPHIFAVGGGGAKDEISARVGLVFGNFLKRFVTILWGLTGVLAFALYGQVVSDPDMIWGYATRQLLGPGFVGLMITCLLAAAMSSADVFMISGSALFTKNLYQPLFPKKSESHYVSVGRIVSAGMLLGATALSLYFNNVLSLIKYIWQLPIIFGSVFWLSIVWRRVTRPAALMAVIYSGLMIVVLPVVLPLLPLISSNDSLLVYTQKKIVQVRAGATEVDVRNGLAEEAGQLILKDHIIAPEPVFFDEIIVENDSEQAVSRGKGRISPNLLILHLTGLQLRVLSKSGLATVSYLMDMVAPFILMFVISVFTSPVSKDILDPFYARFMTPIHKNSQADRRAVEGSLKNLHHYKQKKLFPESQWEILKPSRVVTLGFLACLGLALLVLGFAFIMVNIRVP
ncbi:hypothetical protein BVY01_00020, partial [bacterium I07]